MMVQETYNKPLQGITIPGTIGKKIVDLQQRGYQLLFTREPTCLYCIELNRWITTESFTVDECYHFEDSSNPDRDRLLYAITSTDELKGFLIEANFVYQDNISYEMARKLTTNYSMIVAI